MAVVDRSKTFVYRHDDWAEDSFIVFRRDKGKEDTDAIVALTVEITPDFNVDKILEAQRRGEDYRPEVKQTNKMHALAAMIIHMAVGEWRGSEFLVPSDYGVIDENGMPVVDEKSGDPVVHPLAGKPMPFTPEWVMLQEEYQLEDMRRYLNKKWGARRSPAQEKEFPVPDSSVA
jgi:hypothetical protein